MIYCEKGILTSSIKPDFLQKLIEQDELTHAKRVSGSG